MPQRIFISYAREDDEPFVRRLHKDLSEACFEVWWDRVSLPSRQLTFYQEIADAIRSHDRLILIVGPRAAVSDYVRQEWRWALELDKPVIPILRKGDYTHIPGDLSLLHYADFRDDAQYEGQLARLIENLRLPEPPLGALFGVPSLPPHFLARPELLRRVKEALFLDLQKPVAITGAASRLGLHGMGGIGKSVLASLLARDAEVRHAFPDGIYWLVFGKHADLAAIQCKLTKGLGGNYAPSGLKQGRIRLSGLLSNKRALLIFDGVWEPRHVDAVCALPEQCRAVVTTYNASLLGKRNRHGVGPLTDSEAARLLASWAQVSVEAVPSAIVESCGHIPLALAICGAMVRGGMTWSELGRALVERQEQSLSDPSASVLRSVRISYNELTPEQQKRFTELSLFLDGGTVPESVLLDFWHSNRGLTDEEGRNLLLLFQKRALLSIEAELAMLGCDSVRNVSLHETLLTFAAACASEYRHDGDSPPMVGARDGNARTAGDLAEGIRACTAAVEQQKASKDRISASKETATSGKPPPSGHGSVSASLMEDVQFTVFRPQVIAPEKWYSLLAFAHLRERRPDAPADEPDPLQEVHRQACRVLGEEMQGYRLVTQDSTEAIPVEEELTFLPEIPGIEFNPPRAVFLWIESVHRQDFRLRATLAMDGQTARGRISVLFGMRIIADVPLVIRVDSQFRCPGGAAPIETVTARPYRKVFASYSHEDVDIVDEFERIITACGDQYLRDSLTLRAGEVWSDRLSEMIREADVFQLFWSRNSMVSTFVRQEWEHALSLNRQHFLRPIYWEEPFPENRALCLPPDALRRLHFQNLRRPRGQAGAQLSSEHPQPSQRGPNANDMLPWECQKGVSPKATAKTLHTLDGHEGWVFAVAVTGDGRYAVSGSLDQTLKVWDLASGKALHTLGGHKGWVFAVAVRDDGRYAVSGSDDKTLMVWDLASGKAVQALRGHRGRVVAVAVTGDGRYAVSGSLDQTLKVWALASGKAHTLRGHEGEVWAVAVTKDGRYAVSGSSDTTLKIWDLSSGQVVASFCGESAFRSCAVAPDGRTIVAGDALGRVHLLRLENMP
ncbi:MAG: TIR domain-containing protein [Planctomycetes bacterium]|nr:TIR domain-containing protein [Planctomycetota bacterium]